LALTALSDGRPVSVGTGSFGERDAGYVAEIWNPKTGIWATLPELPLDSLNTEVSCSTWRVHPKFGEMLY
jgi:hypothetical protein